MRSHWIAVLGLTLALSTGSVAAQPRPQSGSEPDASVVSSKGGVGTRVEDRVLTVEGQKAGDDMLVIIDEVSENATLANVRVTP